MSDDTGEAFVFGLISGLFCGLLLLFMVLVFTNETNRKGYFYVSSESTGTVVRMDNDSGNSTSITKPMSTEEAISICNKLNQDLKDKAY